jgi:hypothetical protein
MRAPELSFRHVSRETVPALAMAIRIVEMDSTGTSSSLVLHGLLVLATGEKPTREVPPNAKP